MFYQLYLPNKYILQRTIKRMTQNTQLQKGLYGDPIRFTPEEQSVILCIFGSYLIIFIIYYIYRKLVSN